MVTELLVITGRGFVRKRALIPPSGMLNVIVAGPAAALAQLMASRSEPGTLSFFTVTTRLHPPLALTVTLNEQVLELPTKSVVLQVTAVTPTGNNEPDGGVQIERNWDVQLSVIACTEKFTARLVCPAGAFVTMFAGQVMVGISVSLTVTVKEQFVTPTPFAAVQSTLVVPTRNGCGEVMFVSFVTQMTTGAGVPVAGTLKATKREHSPGALFVVMFAGH